jgi:hypothetical protein
MAKNERSKRGLNLPSTRPHKVSGKHRDSLPPKPKKSPPK